MVRRGQFSGRERAKSPLLLSSFREGTRGGKRKAKQRFLEAQTLEIDNKKRKNEKKNVFFDSFSSVLVTYKASAWRERNFRAKQEQIIEQPRPSSCII